MKTKEEFLIELEKTFDNLSWGDIIQTVNESVNLNVQDDVVDNIVNYVKERNKISFKQWKVLRCFINDINKRNLKYKYGK